jgi:hypothetical protein
MKTKCVDKAGKTIRIYDYEMKLVQVGASFYVDQVEHIVVSVKRDEEFVTVELLRKVQP